MFGTKQQKLNHEATQIARSLSAYTHREQIDVIDHDLMRAIFALMDSIRKLKIMLYFVTQNGCGKFTFSTGYICSFLKIEKDNYNKAKKDLIADGYLSQTEDSITVNVEKLYLDYYETQRGIIPDDDPVWKWVEDAKAHAITYSNFVVVDDEGRTGQGGMASQTASNQTSVNNTALNPTESNHTQPQSTTTDHQDAVPEAKAPAAKKSGAKEKRYVQSLSFKDICNVYYDLFIKDPPMSWKELSASYGIIWKTNDDANKIDNAVCDRWLKGHDYTFKEQYDILKYQFIIEDSDTHEFLGLTNEPVNEWGEDRNPNPFYDSNFARQEAVAERERIEVFGVPR